MLTTQYIKHLRPFFDTFEIANDKAEYYSLVKNHQDVRNEMDNTSIIMTFLSAMITENDEYIFEYVPNSICKDLLFIIELPSNVTDEILMNLLANKIRNIYPSKLRYNNLISEIGFIDSNCFIISRVAK